MSLESRASQRNYSRSEKPPLPAKPSRTSSRASLASNQSRASTVSRASIASSIPANHQDALNRSTRSAASGGSDQLNASINSQMSNTNSGPEGQNQTNESNTNAVLEEPVSVISDETIEDGYVISQDQALDDTIQSEKETEKDDIPVPGENL